MQIQLKGYFVASVEAVSNFFKKPNTVMFPNEHVPIPEGFRGVPVLIPDECLLCNKCVRGCPTEALSIEDIDDNYARFTVDLGRCCYCQECETSCTFGAMKLTDEWLTSNSNREALKIHYQVEKGKKKKKKE